MSDKASDLRDLAAEAFALAQRASDSATRTRLTVIAQKLTEMADQEGNALEHVLKDFNEHILLTALKTKPAGSGHQS
jgi:hypothetical protein